MPTPLAIAAFPVAQNRGEAGDAEQRIGTEDQRVEEIVVDAAIEDVDLPQPVNVLHVEFAIDANEVLTLDQLDAHLLREEDVLEERGVEGAGRQQRDSRIGFARRRHLHQALQQVGGVTLDAADARCAHQGRDEPRHDDAIFDHVGNAARSAHVVFEDIEAAVGAAHEIDSRDRDEITERRLDADCGAAKLRASEDQIARDDAV